MKIKEEEKFYKFKLFFSRIRHGLFLLTLKRGLSRFGLEMGPYYLIREGFLDIEIPDIKGNKEDYEFGFLNVEDIRNMPKVSVFNRDNLEKEIAKGMRFIGLKHNDKIAAFMSIQYGNFFYKRKRFELQKNEVYLLNMYTFQYFRGKNLAPYLRYLSYELLKKEGIVNMYSVSDYFNKSSLRFKKKLKAQPIVLYFYMVLFKSYYRTFKLKSFQL